MRRRTALSAPAASSEPREKAGEKDEAVRALLSADENSRLARTGNYVHVARDVLHRAIALLLRAPASPARQEARTLTEGERARIPQMIRVVQRDIRSDPAADEIVAALRSLLSPPPTPPHEGSEAGRWVPWKPGDALPAHGEYWVTSERGGTDRLSVYAVRAESNRNPADDWAWYGVIAYWSAPLPPPYQPDVAGGKS
jgi:hypothetical protein